MASRRDQVLRRALSVHFVAWRRFHVTNLRKRRSKIMTLRIAELWSALESAGGPMSRLYVVSREKVQDKA